jgi:double-strand break repair protein MRE11
MSEPSTLACYQTGRKVGILSIQRGQFNIEPIPLKTVRPFKIGDIILEEEADNDENGIDLQKRETITAFLKIKASSGDPVGRQLRRTTT